ncbi:MAG: MBOAT family protein [Solobacterium sp.]|nr:MBOAT family protein [Solobacterium sp.]
MTYASLKFWVFLLPVLLLYRLVPLKHRWMVLLAGSMVFYALNVPAAALLVFLVQIALAFGCGKVLEGNRHRAALAVCIIVSALPLILVKLPHGQSWIVPLGLSFYTLQMIAYLVDVYRGKIRAADNPFRFALFMSWFPQIIQGPLPRYELLNEQLQEGHARQEEDVQRGIALIIWGLFLKLMIADKAAPLVNEVFDHYTQYSGVYYWTALILYSAQLYTDFLSCVRLSQGISLLFGIRLGENFRRPYASRSVKEFWQRWHISLGAWLRDYIYIPLGGSRRGRMRKYVSILTVFLISGFWHGSGLNFLCWGLLHAFCEILEDVLGEKRLSSAFLTYCAVLLGWLIFRAPGLRAGLSMLKGMFLDVHPAVLFDGSLLRLGIDGYDAVVLCFSLLMLYLAGRLYGDDPLEAILNLPVWKKDILLIGMIALIMVFGTYGYGFNAAGFIYGGF